jgi:murein DD-endopeptidase MepM/ murein hydrolase activator NlpD
VVYHGIPSDGWGNMLILAHRVTDTSAPCGYRLFETVYAHMQAILVDYGAEVERGQLIGKVGTANGKYFAHLHFEVRESRSIYPGAGYADAPLDRVSPDAFIAMHRGAAEDQIQPAPHP